MEKAFWVRQSTGRSARLQRLQQLLQHAEKLIRYIFVGRISTRFKILVDEEGKGQRSSHGYEYNIGLYIYTEIIKSPSIDNGWATENELAISLVSRLVSFLSIPALHLLPILSHFFPAPLSFYFFTLFFFLNCNRNSW